MPIIKPSIGRKVWFWPVNDIQIGVHDPKQACDATVVFVHNDTCVNLSIKDHSGFVHTRTSVHLHQGLVSDRPPSSCATWMPYQQGQAAKEAATDTAAA